MVIKYVIYDYNTTVFTTRSDYCIIKYNIKKNMLTFGSKQGRVNFVIEVMDNFFSPENSEEYIIDDRYKGFVRFNFGMYLKNFMLKLERFENLGLYTIEKIQKIERMM